MRAATKSPYMARDEAVVALQEQFRKTAARLACGNAALRDDLVSVMNQAVLENKKERATLGFYANGAAYRARDFRRKHFLRERPELKRLYQPGERGRECREEATPEACAREREELRAGKHGRPPDDASGPKRFLVIRTTPAAIAAFKRMAKESRVTHEMLLRGGLAMLAQAKGDEGLAGECIRV